MSEKLSEKMQVLELYSKQESYKFSDEEIKLIKKHTPKSGFKIRYAFYNKNSYKEKYIVFIIDSMPTSYRRSGVENNWEYFCEREISDIEYLEQIQNFGCNKRRFTVWNYQKIEQLIADDLLYNVETPEAFINECRKRGYYGNYQSKLNFDDF